MVPIEHMRVPWFPPQGLLKRHQRKKKGLKLCVQKEQKGSQPLEDSSRPSSLRPSGPEKAEPSRTQAWRSELTPARGLQKRPGVKGAGASKARPGSGVRMEPVDSAYEEQRVPGCPPATTPCPQQKAGG